MTEVKRPAEYWSAIVNQLEQHGRHLKPYAGTTQRSLEFIEQNLER